MSLTEERHLPGWYEALSSNAWRNKTKRLSPTHAVQIQLPNDGWSRTAFGHLGEIRAGKQALSQASIRQIVPVDELIPGAHTAAIDRDVADDLMRLAMPAPMPDGIEFKYHPDYPYDLHGHRRGPTAYAVKNYDQIGHVTWKPDGEVEMIQVHPDYQRHGIATALFDYAKQHEPNLHHSPWKSDLGEAWSSYEKSRHAGLHGDLPESITFQHHPAGFEPFPDVIQPNVPVSNSYPTVSAHDGDKMIGHLQWRDDGHPRRDNEIWDLRVHPDYQRRGVATALFDWTTDKINPDLKHSNNLSDEGRAFAEAEDRRPLAEDRYEAWRNGQPMPKRFAMAWDQWAPQIKGGCDNGCDHDRMMMGEYSIDHTDGGGDHIPGLKGRSLLQFNHDTDQHGNPEIYVSGIHVDENHRRDGIAEALMRRMRQDHPDTPINPGFTTDDGQGLLDGLKKRVPGAGEALVPRFASIVRRDGEDDVVGCPSCLTESLADDYNHGGHCPVCGQFNFEYDDHRHGALRVAMPWYHNTDADLNPGDELLPAAERGHNSQWSEVPTYDPHSVYIYNNDFGDYYDSHGKNQYEVEPLGPVNRDPEFETNKADYMDELEDDDVYSDNDVPGAHSHVTPRARVIRKMNTVSRTAMPTYYHVAPRRSVDSIRQHGLDYTKGEAVWHHDGTTPGNYFWDHPGYAEQYAEELDERDRQEYGSMNWKEEDGHTVLPFDHDGPVLPDPENEWNDEMEGRSFYSPDPIPASAFHTAARLAMPTYYHVTPEHNRDSILQHGLDYTRGEEVWPGEDGEEYQRGNFFWDDKEDAHAYAEQMNLYKTHPGKKVNYTVLPFTHDDPVWDDPEGLDGAFYTTDPIPASAFHTASRTAMPDLSHPSLTFKLDNSGSTPKAHAYVDDRSEPVGSLSWFRSNPEHWEGGPAGTVNGIEVHPDYQRRGIATALWDWVKTHVEPDLQHSESRTGPGKAWVRHEKSRMKWSDDDDSADREWCPDCGMDYTDYYHPECELSPTFPPDWPRLPDEDNGHARFYYRQSEINPTNPHTASRLAMPSWYHLTDDPNFTLDPDKEPANYNGNHPFGKGVFLTQRPDDWAYTEDDGGWSGDRPYIAEIDAPENLHEKLNVWHDPHAALPGDLYPGSEEIFVPNFHFPKLKVKNVKPRTAMPQRWVHVSPHELAPGTVLTPGGGESPYNSGETNWYSNNGQQDRQKWVWLDTHRDHMNWVDNLLYDLTPPNGGPTPPVYTYAVEPHEPPWAWNDDSSEGYVTPAATVIKKLKKHHSDLEHDDLN